MLLANLLRGSGLLGLVKNNEKLKVRFSDFPCMAFVSGEIMEETSDGR